MSYHRSSMNSLFSRSHSSSLLHAPTVRIMLAGSILAVIYKFTTYKYTPVHLKPSSSSLAAYKSSFIDSEKYHCSPRRIHGSVSAQ